MSDSVEVFQRYARYSNFWNDMCWFYDTKTEYLSLTQISMYTRKPIVHTSSPQESLMVVALYYCDFFLLAKTCKMAVFFLRNWIETNIVLFWCRTNTLNPQACYNDIQSLSSLNCLWDLGMVDCLDYTIYFVKFQHFSPAGPQSVCMCVVALGGKFLTWLQSPAGLSFHVSSLSHWGKEAEKSTPWACPGTQRIVVNSIQYFLLCWEVHACGSLHAKFIKCQKKMSNVYI